MYCIGDVAELYPSAVEAFVLNVSAIILPEAVFLRSLVILYCCGPYALGQGEPHQSAKGGTCLFSLGAIADAIGGWLLKHVSEVLKATIVNY